VLTRTQVLVSFGSQVLSSGGLGWGKGRDGPRELCHAAACNICARVDIRVVKVLVRVHAILRNQTTPGDVPNINDIGKVQNVMQAVLNGNLAIQAGGADAFMFPRQIWTNDHMHMYFNSLEETVKRDAQWNGLYFASLPK
jgi:hypothetical protein